MIEKDAGIVFNRKVAHATFLMGLNAPEIAGKAAPGQFVMLRVTKGIDPLLRRPFSISGVQGTDTLLILYRVVGRGTTIMSEKGEGESVSLLGPLGNGFDLGASKKKMILAAGGIGIAPLLFAAQRLDPSSYCLLTGFRSKQEIIGADDTGIILKNNEISTDDGSFGRKGFVTDLLKGRIERDGRQGVCLFTCGPLLMLKNVVKIAIKEKIPCQASLEANMACGLGACQGCAVPASVAMNETYYHVCQDGPVFEMNQIDWDRI